jgi:hypothetical protein
MNKTNSTISLTDSTFGFMVTDWFFGVFSMVINERGTKYSMINKLIIGWQTDMN